MKKILSIYAFLLFLSCSQNNTVTYNFDTLFEKSEGKETDTYFNVISFYKNFTSLKEARKISDHIPIWFEFSLN